MGVSKQAIERLRKIPTNSGAKTITITPDMVGVGDWEYIKDILKGLKQKQKQTDARRTIRTGQEDLETNITTRRSDTDKRRRKMLILINNELIVIDQKTYELLLEELDK